MRVGTFVLSGLPNRLNRRHMTLATHCLERIARQIQQKKSDPLAKWYEEVGKIRRKPFARLRTTFIETAFNFVSRSTPWRRARRSFGGFSISLWKTSEVFHLLALYRTSFPDSVGGQVSADDCVLKGRSSKSPHLLPGEKGLVLFFQFTRHEDSQPGSERTTQSSR